MNDKIKMIIIKIVFIIGIIKIINCQKIVNGPSDKFVELSKNVMLECQIDDYNNDIDLIEWCKNGFCTWGRVIELENGILQYKSLNKYFIVGDRKKGEWNLLIKNVTESEIGDYECTVTRRADTMKKFYSNKARLKLMGKSNLLF
jgi:hypothetical protein